MLQLFPKGFLYDSAISISFILQANVKIESEITVCIAVKRTEILRTTSLFQGVLGQRLGKVPTLSIISELHVFMETLRANY